MDHTERFTQYGVGISPVRHRRQRRKGTGRLFSRGSDQGSGIRDRGSQDRSTPSRHLGVPSIVGTLNPSGKK